MGTMTWTEDQKKVIDLRKRNILVSAAAGSGKTAVLVERIIQMITDDKHPIDIDRLLIVTFTSAAAGEMRERIGAAIEARLQTEADNSHLQKQMLLIHGAPITTIHSFCLGIIRDHFNQINLDPGFRMGDEAEIRLMKSDVLKEVLEQAYEEGDERFLQFVESYSTGKSDLGMEDMVLKLHEFSMSYPWPEQWLQGTLEAFPAKKQVLANDNVKGTSDTLAEDNIKGTSDVLAGDNAKETFDISEEISHTVWMTALLNGIHPVILDALEENEHALAVVEEGNGPYMYKEALEDDRKWLLRLRECSTYTDYQKILFEMDWKRLSAKKDPTVDVDKKEAVKELRNGIKDSINQIQKQFFFQRLENSYEDMKRVRTPMEALVQLTLDFSRAFAKRKEEKNVLDFNDLEHFALNILVKEGKTTPVALELSEFFEEILVDEYQDSNFVQETLLNSISKEKSGQPNLFMVGDVKQSIYKFRLARPELFLEKYDSYSTEDGKYQRIDLHKNFRSREVVLAGINSVFEQIMHRNLGGIEYDQDAALYPGADYPECEDGSIGGKCEVLLLDGKEEGAEELTGKEMEVQAIIQRIRELEAEGYLVWDKNRYRPMHYGDVVILLRTMSGWADQFVRILGEEGIPAYADTQTGYFSAMEVHTVLNLLLIIDNPRQDIPFTAVLLSEIGGFSHEELGIIRSPFRDKSMYESLKCFCQAEEILPEKLPTEKSELYISLMAKTEAFLVLLKHFREMVPYTTVYDLLQEIYKETRYYNYVSVLPGGAVRKANLDMLLQKAIDFQGTSYHGLFHFNRYIEKLHQYNIDYGEGSGDNGTQTAVRIMSIHKSKGLEFPVVFLAGMGKSFNQQDARSRLILHPDLGIGPDFVEYEKRMKTPTLLKKVMQRQIVLENLGEELRVLYVAMTRAKEKLIMVGQVKDLEKKLVKWERDGRMSFQRFSSATSYLDWVMPCAGKDDQNFEVRPMGLGEIVANEVEMQIFRENIKQQLLHWKTEKYLSDEMRRKINFIFNFSYSFQAEQEIKSKISVSEFKKRKSDEEEEPSMELFPKEISFHEEELIAEKETIFGEDNVLPYIPKFVRNQEETTGTWRGTVYHKVLECISFKGEMKEKKKLNEELTKLVEQNRMETDELKLIKREQLLHFFQSELGKRMILANERGQLYREQPFVLGVPAKRIYNSVESDELVIVQGIIDAYFLEDDKVVLVDYKTDRVSNKEELIGRYHGQLDYYQEALEQITQKKVVEKLIYSFGLEEILVI